MGIALTIGNFDGVHRGHRDLIARLTGSGLESYVITFEPHPLEVLYPERQHKRLFSFEDQEVELKKLGIKKVIVQNFTREFARTPPREFLEKDIFKKNQPQLIVVGHDFAFGSEKSGHHDLLKEVAQDHQCRVEIVPAFKEQGEVISSSLIRRALLEGEVEKAMRLLGRPYYLQGTVEHGESRGRQIGFPTANLKPEVPFVPKMGVYMTHAEINGRQWQSVTNIGINKTFVGEGPAPVKIETHILNMNEDLYGKKIKIEFVHYLREEKKFSSIDELKQQIQKDIQQALGVKT